MKQPKSIRSLFALPGFVRAPALVGVFGDRHARVIVRRRQKGSSRFPVMAEVSDGDHGTAEGTKPNPH
jgi:hypothetical protein